MNGLDEIRKEIENLTYHSESMGCGLEDLDITDRYEACEYGWNEAIESVMEVINNYEDHDNTDISIKCNNCSRRKWYMLGYEDAVKEEPGVTKEFLKQCKQAAKKYEKNYNGWISLKERMPTKEECEKDNNEFLVQADTGEIFSCEYDPLANGFDDPLWCCNVPVVAWQSLPEPYYPERSDNHEGE